MYTVCIHIRKSIYIYVIYMWYIYIYVIYVFYCGQLPCFRAYPDIPNACAFIINHNFWIMSWWLMVDGLQTFFPKQCGHTGGSYGSYKGRVFIRGGLMRAQHHLVKLTAQTCSFVWKMSVCISTAQARTNQASRRTLAQSSRHFARVRSFSLWRGANF